MNIFGGIGNMTHGGNNCICNLVWLMFLLSICGCDNSTLFGGDCMNIIFLLLLLSCCGCSNNTPCGN